MTERPVSLVRRILVAVDASHHSIAALEAAVELATRFQAELLGLYVEDINLLRLAQLPFGREVGTFSHRLPADMTVDDASHRTHAEELWKLPHGTINPKVGSHIVQMMRDLEDGTLRELGAMASHYGCGVHIHCAEDGADADRQRHQRDGREAGTLAKRAQGVFEVLPEHVAPPSSPAEPDRVREPRRRTRPRRVPAVGNLAW